MKKPVTTFDHLLVDKDVRLTTKQFKFAEKYLECFNQTQAYIYSFGEGKSVKNMEMIRRLAYNTLRIPKIQEYIQARRKEMRVSRVLDTDRVLDELIAIGFTNITDLFDEIDDNGKPKFKRLDQLTPEQRKAIKKIDYKTTYTKNGVNRHLSIELHDKKGVLEMIAKILELYKDGNVTNIIDNSQNLTVNKSIEIDPKDLTDEQLDKYLSQLENKEKSTNE